MLYLILFVNAILASNALTTTSTITDPVNTVTSTTTPPLDDDGGSPIDDILDWVIAALQEILAGDPSAYVLLPCQNDTDCEGSAAEIAGEALTCNIDFGICIPGCDSQLPDCGDLAGIGLTECDDIGNYCTADPTCETDEDCPAEVFICQEGMCFPDANALNGTCSTNDDCADAEPGFRLCTDVGVGTICGPETCETTADCVSENYVCYETNGICLPSCSDGGNAGCEAAGLLGSTCDEETGICQTGICQEDDDCGFVSANATCEEITSPIGNNITFCFDPFLNPTCTEDSDCTSSPTLNRCLVDAGICYAGCFDSTDCSAPLPVCTDDPAGQGLKICGPSDTGSSCGGDGDCADGYSCAPIVDACYPECETTADCEQLFGGGGNWQCDTITIPATLITPKYEYTNCITLLTPATTAEPTAEPTMSPTLDDSGDDACSYGIFVAMLVMGIATLM